MSQINSQMNYKTKGSSVPTQGKKKKIQLSICKPVSAKPNRTEIDTSKITAAPKKKSISNFVTAYLSNPNTQQSQLASLLKQGMQK